MFIQRGEYVTMLTSIVFILWGQGCLERGFERKDILPGFNLTVLVATRGHLAEILAMGLSTPGGN